MKRRNKLALGIVALAATALFAAGCTANFATNKEKARIAYALEPGVSEFVVGAPESSEDIAYQGLIGGNVYQVIRAYKDDNGNVTSYKHSGLLNDIITSAKKSAVAVPSLNYFVEFDKEAFNIILDKYNADHPEGTIDLATVTGETLNICLDDYGYWRFYKEESNQAYSTYNDINAKLREAHKGDANPYEQVVSLDFEKFYTTNVNATVDRYRSVITVYGEVKYGTLGRDEASVWLDKVTWKQAWGKGGHLIEGLIVYPVAWLVDTFAIMFAGGRSAGPQAISNAYKTGGPQILSILVVTIIVRLFIFLCTFRSTLAQKKMTELQPELAKIQQKYPNANTNQAQKQRLAEEQMRLYKKHKVNPLSQLLVLIIQFPVFIGVWGAMTGSAVLSTGKFLDLNLSASIWETLKVGPKAHPGWWTALILILLMSAGQFFAMKVPQWIQKAKTKKVAKFGKNPAQTQQNRTANMVSYVMLAMIIVMGFTLPAAMGVYWFVGAIVSLIQTVLTTVVFAGGKKKK